MSRLFCYQHVDSGSDYTKCSLQSNGSIDLPGAHDGTRRGQNLQAPAATEAAVEVLPTTNPQMSCAKAAATPTQPTHDMVSTAIWARSFSFVRFSMQEAVPEVAKQESNNS